MPTSENHKTLIEVIKRLNDPSKPIYAADNLTVNQALNKYTSDKYDKSSAEYVTTCTSEEAGELKELLAGCYRSNDWSPIGGKASSKVATPTKPAPDKPKDTASAESFAKSTAKPKVSKVRVPVGGSLDEIVQAMIDKANEDRPEPVSNDGTEEQEARIKALEERLEKQAGFIKNTLYPKFTELEKQVEALKAPTKNEGDLDL